MTNHKRYSVGKTTVNFWIDTQSWDVTPMLHINVSDDDFGAVWIANIGWLCFEVEIFRAYNGMSKRKFTSLIRFWYIFLANKFRRFFLKPLSMIWMKFGRYQLDEMHGTYCFGFMWLYHAPCCMLFTFCNDFWCYIAKPIEKQ